MAEYGSGWFGGNLLPDEAAAKIRKLEELAKANSRKLSDLEIVVSPSGKKITADDLKRYRDAGVDEVVIVTVGPQRTVEEAATNLEAAARAWLEPAAKV